MSDGEVLSNFYLNSTSDLPEDAYQALQNRAADFAAKVRVGNVSNRELKKTSNAIAANNVKIQNPLGESTDWMVNNIENVLLGKKGNKGRIGSFVWNGNDFYEETEEEDEGGTHYWNVWIGCFDKPRKTIYLNSEKSITKNRIISAGRNLKWNLKKTENQKPKVDMGYEEDSDPLYTEAYSSGRVDGGDEPSWEDMEGHYDEENYNDDYSFEEPLSIEELRQSSDELKRSTLLEELKEAVADRIDDLSKGEYNYNRIYDVVDKYITNAHKKYNTKELEKYSRVYGGKVDFFAKIILTKFKKQISLH